MKAQMEAFGLIFVMILVLVGFLIFIKLAPDDTSGVQSEYERTQMAYNFIDSVLQVSTVCGNQRLGSILSTCENPNLVTGLPCDSGEHPCNESIYMLELALNHTLDAMEYQYQLNMSVVRGPVLFSIPNKTLTCTQRVRAGIYPFQSPITGRMLELRLDICS